jgi:AraC family transcriptional regulator, regulatory protein of adaptative response / DNA-3-methyladenine glycosylase II
VRVRFPHIGARCCGQTGPVLVADHCYRLLQTRDRRFDGWFVTAVRTTGIYCRPSCPAVMPKRPNVEFFPTSAAAQQHGYRACKRCRPDASPGSPEWDVRGDVVARAVRLVADGVVDREGVPGLARRLGYSERHLNRVMTDELGAGPLAIARAQRAHTARTLLETTDMALPAVAAASGFGSLRQFNDTIREVFAATPSTLRRSRRTTAPTPAGAVDLELPVREPFAAADLLAFFAARAIPGVEHWDGVAFRRALRLPRGHGVVVLTAPAPVGRARRHVAARLHLADWRDLGAAVRRVRRLLDLDADPISVDEALAGDAALAPSVAATPGLRVPGSVDPFETAVRAVIGQQISVAGARTVAGRIVAGIGERLAIDGGPVTHVFPSADALADADPTLLPMPRQRQRTVCELARRVAADELVLDVGADRDALATELVDVPGIGPWTAGYVLMRGLGDPDVFLPTDLGVRVGLDVLGLPASSADRWRPFRSYGLHHLWSVAGSSSSRPVQGG